MRRDRMTVPTLLIAVVLASLVSFSCVMCLRDAFSMECRPLTLLAVCGGAAVLAAAAMWPRRSWPFLLAGVLAYGVLLLWQREALVQSVRYVLHRISSQYAYCFENFRVIGDGAGSAFWTLTALGIPLAWLTAWVASREGSVVLVILACLPVLVLCLLIVELAPVLWLILLIGALMVLLVSHSVRERSPAEGSRLAWWLVLPTIILVSGITVLWPPADYERADWSEMLQSIAEAKVNVEVWQEQTFSVLPQWNRKLKQVDLSRVGPKAMTGTPVLDYRTDSGISYLRGVSLGVYGDNTWTAVDPVQYRTYGIEQTPLVCAAADGTLELRTRSREPLLYTAYDLAALPEGAAAVDDAYVENTEGLKEYTVTFGSGAGAAPAGYDRLAAEQYLQIPEALREPLAAFAAEAGLEGASARTVADYVRSCGVYDLNTPRVPEGEDFVLYFLQESRRGYCIHFASATVMLLRSVGIPARYVTGYAVSGEAGEWVEVTEDDAHAWVEYYVNGLGWVELDPTPADRSREEPPAEQETALPEQEETEPVQPEEQEPPEEQAQPSLQIGGEAAEAAPTGGVRLQLPRKLLWLLVLPGMLLLIWLRRWFGLRYRRERCTKGHPNRRALTWWRWLVQLYRVDSLQVPEELLCLAEKARFSQHTMTEDELARLQQAAEGRIEALKTAPAKRRLWHKYGLVLY